MAVEDKEHSVPEEPSVPGPEDSAPSGNEPLVSEHKAPVPAAEEPVQGTPDLLSNDDLENLLASLNSSVEPTGEVEAGDAPAAEEPVEGTSELLSNDDLEDLLTDLYTDPKEVEDKPCVEGDAPAEAATEDEFPEHEEFEVPVPVAEEPAPDTSGLLSNDDINDLLSSLTSGKEDADALPAAEPAVVERVLGSEAEPVAEAEPVVEAQKEEAPAAPTAATEVSLVAEPAEGASASGELVTQEMLEALVRDAKQAGSRAEPDAEAAPEAPKPARSFVPMDETPEPVAGREARPRRRFISTQMAASIAVGLFSASCLYLYLVTHPYRQVDAEVLREHRRADPGLAVGVAKGLIEGGHYSEGLSELDAVIDELPAGQERADAEFLRAEADYHLMPRKAKIPVIKNLAKKIDELLAHAPEHPRALEARLWRADLYRRSDMPEAAYNAYSELLANPEPVAGMDAVLLDAARTAMDLDKPQDAIDALRRLLQNYPKSVLRGEASLALGEAYLASGDLEAGRMLLMSVGKGHPNSEIGAAAFARLGGLAYESGDYDEAIRLFETRLQTATKVAGNEHIYLLLARAHRAKGDLAGAERILRELVDFFPESEEMPLALVELSQVLDGLGKREEAVNVAKQASQQYPDNPEALSNAGRFLAQAGDAVSGAQALLAAEKAGAESAAVLLEAARHLRSANELDAAAKAYEKILNDYPEAPEALTAAIERARLDVDRGKMRSAIERLEKLAAEQRGRPGHPEALSALATLYAESGLPERAGEVFGELAASTSDSTLLAKAVMAMLDAGLDEAAWAVAARIDAAALPEPVAYGLLMRQGRALVDSEPESAVLLMEEAYGNYPDERRPDDVQILLETTLGLERTAAARVLVMDLGSRVKTNPADAPLLERAAACWGDYLYRRGDYRAAAEAYVFGANAAGTGQDAPESRERLWCRLQQANCLLRMEDLQASRPLFEEVAASESEWRELARTKADYVKLELRRRGVPDEAPAEPSREG